MTDSFDGWEGKTVFVTGGLGFVGSHAVEQLLARGATVVATYRSANEAIRATLPATRRLRLLRIDVLDFKELQAAFTYVAPRIDAVVHCAAVDGNAEFKITHAAEILDANLRITSNVLNCAREQGVRDVVLVSSAEIYSGPHSGRIREDDDYHSQLRYSANGYFLSKAFIEMLGELHRDQFGMNVFMPRPVNVYGPRDGLGSASRVIPSMIGKIAAGEEVDVWGDGRQTRTFVHVGDMVRTTLRMVETRAFQTFNVGGTEPVSILGLARLLSEFMGEPLRVRLHPDKPTGAAERLLDLTRMERVIDFTPTPLAEGLRETVAWFRRSRR